MWTTWNFRADAARLAAAMLLLGACVGVGTAPGRPAPAAPPPDSPRPAPPRAAHVQETQAPSGHTPRPLEIRALRVRPVRGDSLLTRLVGAHRVRQAQDPVVVEAVTVDSLGSRPQAAAPQIYLNGERVAETWARPPDRLYAFLPDRQRLRGRVEVTAAWVGRERLTRSRRPVVLQDGQPVP